MCPLSFDTCFVEIHIKGGTYYTVTMLLLLKYVCASYDYAGKVDRTLVERTTKLKKNRGSGAFLDMIKQQ